MPADSRARPSFQELFQQHWQLGTGLARHAPKLAEYQKGWTEKSFGDAMAKVGGAAPDPKTIRDWRQGKRRIQPRNKDAILACFFPVPLDEAAEKARAEMEAAWSRAPTGHAGEAEDAPSYEDVTPWQLDAPESLLDALVELRLHQPDPTNQGGFRLRATLAVDSRVLRETQGGEDLFVSLKDPVLHLASPGFPTKEGTKAGTSASPHAHLVSKPNGWTVLGTAEADGGDLIGDAALVEVGPDGSSEGAVTLTLKGTRHTILLTRLDAEGGSPASRALSNEKAAVLDALFGIKLTRDAEGALILARHAMHRKSDA